MSASLALRRLSTTAAATATATATATKSVTISQTKSKMRNMRDPDEALKIYSTFTSTNDPSTSPASIRYAQELTVRRLAKSNRFSDIETFLESHKSKPQITDEPYVSSLIRSYGTVGMFQNALNTYNQMTEFGTPRSSLSFNALLYACVHSKEFHLVPVYFDEFPTKFGFLPDKFSYGILIKSYCELGSPDTAIEKLSEMEEKGIEVSGVLFTTILHGLYKKGEVGEAEKFWDEMVTKKGLKPDVGAYNVKLSHIHCGSPEDVKALIEEMNNAGIKPDTITYNYLITCYCENGMMDEAKKVYDDVLNSKGCNPNAATFRVLVFNLCKKGRFMTGYKVFKQSVKMHKIPDFNTLKYLVEGLVTRGHTLQAREMIRTMNKKFPTDLLKAWGKVVDDLGLAPIESEEGDIDKKVDSDETQEIST